jgi:hypothetical protein
MLLSRYCLRTQQQAFMGPECWADWLREKVLSRKTGVLGDVHEIAVAKANNGYSRTAVTRHCFRSKGLVRSGWQDHVMLLHEQCRYFGVPTLCGAV